MSTTTKATIPGSRNAKADDLLKRLKDSGVPLLAGTTADGVVARWLRIEKHTGKTAEACCAEYIRDQQRGEIDL